MNRIHDDERAARQLVVEEAWRVLAEQCHAMLLRGPAETLQLLRRQHHAQQVEWKSLVDSSRRAIHDAEAHRFELLAAQNDAIIAARDARIASLTETVAIKDGVIGDLYATIAASDAVTEQKLREQRKDTMAMHEETRMEAQRQAGLRERTRFEADAARADRDAAKAMLDSATKRAAAATDALAKARFASLVDLERASRDLTTSSESDLRASIHRQAQDSVRLIQTGVEQLEQACSAMVASVASHLAVAGAATIDAVLARFDAQRDAAEGRRAAEFDKLTQHVHAIEECFRRQEEQLAAISDSATAKCAALEAKNAMMTTAVAKMSHQVNSATEARAKLKTRAAVLDDLVAEHDAEVAELKATLAQAEESCRHYAAVNKHDALIKTQQELHEVSQRLAAITQERNGFSARVSALEAAANAGGQDAAKLVSENQRLRRQLEENRRAGDTRAANMIMLLSDAQMTAKERDDVATAAEDKLGQLEAQLDDVTVDRNSLRSKFDAIREQAHSAEVRANALEREKTAAVEKELERRSDLRKARAEAEQQRLASLRDRDDDTEDATDDATRAQAGSPSDTAVDSSELHVDTVISHLENQVAIVRRERDALRRQLGVAMAEASSAEERRATVMKKYLDLLNAADAAPRREVALRQQEREVALAAQQLEERAAQLDRHELEIKKGHIDLTNKMSALNRAAQHGLAIRPVRSGSLTPSQSKMRFTGVDTQSIASTSTHQGMGVADRGGPAKLTPLMHRAAHSLAPPIVGHPQHPPMPPRAPISD